MGVLIPSAPVFIAPQERAQINPSYAQNLQKQLTKLFLFIAPYIPKSAIYLKIDASLKQATHKKADELGLILSAVINIMLREFVMEKNLYIQNGKKDPKQKPQPKLPVRLT